VAQKVKSIIIIIVISLARLVTNVQIWGIVGRIWIYCYIIKQ